LEDDEIDAFQWKIDQFAQGWIDINMGKEGVSNYIHDLNCGQIADYLFHWHNLYIHLQQGWEALNFAVKNIGFGIPVKVADVALGIASCRLAGGFNAN
jgi:hypothetical protein